MTTPPTPDREQLVKARDAWPVSVHPRLGIGPTYDDIGRWYGIHAGTIRALLDNAIASAEAESEPVEPTCSSCNGTGIIQDVRPICCGKNPDGSCHGGCAKPDYYERHCDRCDGPHPAPQASTATDALGVEALKSQVAFTQGALALLGGINGDANGINDTIWLEPSNPVTCTLYEHLVGNGLPVNLNSECDHDRKVLAEAIRNALAQMKGGA